MPLPPRLIGLPYDASSSFLRGAAEAPPLIRAALHSPAGNSWTERLHDLAGPGGPGDAGDLPLPPTGAARAQIEAGIAGVLAGGWRPLALGSDHSVTYPILRAVSQKHRPLTILHVDAHPDLHDEFAGDRFSHACPCARILEAASDPVAYFAAEDNQDLGILKHKRKSRASSTALLYLTIPSGA